MGPPAPQTFIYARLSRARTHSWKQERVLPHTPTPAMKVLHPVSWRDWASFSGEIEPCELWTREISHRAENQVRGSKPVLFPLPVAPPSFQRGASPVERLSHSATVLEGACACVHAPRTLRQLKKACHLSGNERLNQEPWHVTLGPSVGRQQKRVGTGMYRWTYVLSGGSRGL